MMSGVLLLVVVSAALLVAGLLLLQRGWRRAKSETIGRQLHHEQQSARQLRTRPIGTFQRLLLQAGVQLSPAIASAVLLAIALLAALVGWLWGVLAAAFLIGALGLATHGLMRWRYRRRLSKMIRQTPGLLDHMIRSLKSGRTLGDAMTLAMERCPNPLHEAMAPTRRAIQLGMSLGDALEDFARLHSRQEFHILAMGVRVNQRHGGNASEVLDSLIGMIRDRERAERQLRALTGETRISALVLALLPVLLAVYILFSNPTFFLGLWHDAGGQMMLLVALGLQVLGCWLLWRMLRSI